jgi:cadmium resistance protein CadD (predicted permease)
VVLGQYLGIGALVAVSFAGTAITGVLPGEWIGALGLVPIGLGIREWVRYGGQSAVPTPTGLGRTATSIDSLFAVVATTIANGADNLAVYVPLFASADFEASLTIIVLFAILIAGWCVLGQWLGAHPASSELLRRRAGLVVPLMLIGLGLYIVIINRTWALLL